MWHCLQARPSHKACRDQILLVAHVNDGVDDLVLDLDVESELFDDILFGQ